MILVFKFDFQISFFTLLIHPHQGREKMTKIFLMAYHVDTKT